jgi:hypothetical protein
MLRIERDEAHGARLLTEAPLQAGQSIRCITDYRLTVQPTTHSIQVGPYAHVEGLGAMAYLNHSCAPSAAVDTGAMVLVALRALAAGDELTFFYPSTEWAMATPFVCRCGAPECVRVVAGAKYLSADVLSRYFINPHIRDLLLAAVSSRLPASELLPG